MSNKTTEDQKSFIDTDTAVDNDPAHMIARVNSMAIKVAFPFAAKDDIRYYLNGINIRPLDDGSAMLVATDGHRYVVVRDQIGYCEKEITVRISKDGLKHAGAKNTFDVMSNGDAKFLDAVASPLFLQAGNSLIDGDFPRIENVATTAGYTEGISGAVDPKYLTDALKIGDYFKTIRFFSRDADSALLFVAGGIADLEIFGGIMKVAGNFETLPTWFPKPTPFELTKPCAEQ